MLCFRDCFPPVLLEILVSAPGKVREREFPVDRASSDRTTFN